MALPSQYLGFNLEQEELRTFERGYITARQTFYDLAEIQKSLFFS